ncbi:MAG: alpha/beta family hydrolase [Mycobacteriales bacterium]
MSTIRTVASPRGPARLHEDAGDAGLLVLGHGAGGGPEAPDLLAARDGALDAGWAVCRLEQPWRVAGRRIAEAPLHLDAAWTAVVRELAQRPLVLGGRSSGARVACRTASELGAAAVLALAFPLVPPGRAVSRAHELALPTVPVLVVQGERDAFGVPPGAAVVAGADHGFAVRKRDADPLPVVRELVRAFLQTVT